MPDVPQQQTLVTSNVRKFEISGIGPLQCAFFDFPGHWLGSMSKSLRKKTLVPTDVWNCMEKDTGGSQCLKNGEKGHWSLPMSRITGKTDTNRDQRPKSMENGH
jgi:hypothetical protein